MVNIDLNTAKGIVNLIDVCAKRGAFNGEELESVSTLRKNVLAAAQDDLKAELKTQEAEVAKEAEEVEASVDGE